MIDEELRAHMLRQAQELQAIKIMMQTVVGYIRDAESEVPEKMRRFMNYMHDVHDVKYMYEELGIDVPQHLLRELERVDDRFRQIISEQNAEGGAFNKVRREMAGDEQNRWDHTRQLPKPTHLKEKSNEARTSESIRTGQPEG